MVAAPSSAMQEPDSEEELTSAVVQGEDTEEAEGVPTQLAKDSDFEDVQVQAEEVVKVLDTDTVVKCQMRQPMLRHIKEYITDQVLPASRLETNRHVKPENLTIAKRRTDKTSRFCHVGFSNPHSFCCVPFGCDPGVSYARYLMQHHERSCLLVLTAQADKKGSV